MSAHRISFDVPDSGQTVLDEISAQTNSSGKFENISNYLTGIFSGQRLGKVRFNTNGVQASGTIAFSSFVADDTVTINGVQLTGKASPATTSQWAIGSSDEDCRNNLVTFLNASALNLISGVIGASSRGTVQLSSFVADDTVTVNGVVFTGKSAPSENSPEQFKIGTTDAITAQNLLNCISNSIKPALEGIVVTRSSATLTFNRIGTITLAASAHATVTNKTAVVVSLVPGQIGNLCTLAISAHGTVSGANMTGGTEGTEYVYSKNYVTY